MIELKKRIDEASLALARRKGQQDSVAKEHRELVARLVILSEEMRMETEVQDVLNKLSAVSWNSTKVRLESVVNRALYAVFPDRKYRFIIEQQTIRGTSSVDFILSENGVETDVWLDGGLGVADVVGFSLRIAYMALYRPVIRQVIFLDEPMKNISALYIQNASNFIKQIADELKIQIVIVTHNQELINRADQVFMLEKSDGVCKVI